MSFPIYIQADLADFDSPLDLRRGETPAFWSGSDIEFRIGVYEFGAIMGVSRFTSISVEIKAMGANRARPLPGASALMSKTTTSINKELTSTEWNSFSNCHASIVFSAEESAIAAGTHWLVITAVRVAEGVTESLTLAAGEIIVEQDGHGTIGEVIVSDGSAYTKGASDARYARIIAGSSVYVAANGGSDTTGMRGRADLPFATLSAALASANAGDLLHVAPGSYATAILTKALGFVFDAGVVLDGPLTIESDGVHLSGKLSVAEVATCCATASTQRTVLIDGLLTVNKPLAASLTPADGIVIDTSSSRLTHDGLTSADKVTTLAWSAITDTPETYTPALHAASHAADGSDPLLPASIGAATAEALLAETVRATSAESAKAPLLTPVLTEASSSRTLVLTDAHSLIRCTASSPVSITVPSSSLAAFETGTSILIRQVGPGQVTLVAGSGVMLNTSTSLKSKGQHATLALTKVGADEWDVTGERALS
jgi:hypothetical protein